MSKAYVSNQVTPERIAAIDLRDRVTYTPDWRWKEAGKVERGFKKATDPLVKEVAAYLKIRHRPKIPSTMEVYRVLDEIYSQIDSPGPRWHIEAMLLAGADNNEIASYVGFPSDFIQLYHDIFYDIRRYRQFEGVMITCAMHRLDTWADYDRNWKMIAWRAGVPGLYAYWGGDDNEDVHQILDKHLITNMQKAAILASNRRLEHINPYNEGETIEQYVNMNLRNKEIDKIAGPNHLPGMELRLATKVARAIESVDVPEADLIRRLQGAESNTAGNK